MCATNNIIAVAAEVSRFAVLLRAIEAAGLGEVLASEGPFTLFAPADDSFAELAAGELEGLFADPEDELIPLVLYHLVPGKWRKADFSDGLVTETAEGGRLQFSRKDGALRVNGVHITNGDIEATNGVIHEIAAVLTLPVEDWGWDDCYRERIS